MGRPRRPFNGQETITEGPDPWLAEISPVSLGVRQRARWEASKHWGYPTPNGLYDPLTYLHVLDVVATLDPDIELRAKNLADFLNLARPKFTWDAVTVGKVLSDLRDGFESVLGEKMGMLEVGKDYKGNFYRVHHAPDTAALYYRLREDLMRLAGIEMEAREKGAKPPRLSSPLLECPSLLGEFKDVD